MPARTNSCWRMTYGRIRRSVAALPIDDPQAASRAGQGRARLRPIRAGERGHRAGEVEAFLGECPEVLRQLPGSGLTDSPANPATFRRFHVSFAPSPSI